MSRVKVKKPIKKKKKISISFKCLVIDVLELKANV